MQDQSTCDWALLALPLILGSGGAGEKTCNILVTAEQECEAISYRALPVNKPFLYLHMHTRISIQLHTYVNVWNGMPSVLLSKPENVWYE